MSTHRRLLRHLAGLVGGCMLLLGIEGCAVFIPVVEATATFPPGQQPAGILCGADRGAVASLGDIYCGIVDVTRRPVPMVSLWCGRTAGRGVIIVPGTSFDLQVGQSQVLPKVGTITLVSLSRSAGGGQAVGLLIDPQP